MTREEAHTLLEVMAIELTGELADIECPVTERTKLLGKQLEAIDMAIEALSADAVTHGRLIDADALSEKLCATTIFIKDGEAFQRMINDAPRYEEDSK